MWFVKLAELGEDIPCVCGHSSEVHYFIGCNTCFYNNESQERWQHRLKLDNLTWIETKAKERGLV